ncbi:GNAT family N-acetyltransferase [Butyrivibrio proteoclasticus]|uniref:GNAT family N-acetyltransferase n=1 Tax=Butyrivibrio proteoclasticus TaxID=43305 RepID=UPI0004792762|nr:GNAT family N-acetyltransferase [Butyrivibrio proteoclasticus]
MLKKIVFVVDNPDKKIGETRSYVIENGYGSDIISTVHALNDTNTIFDGDEPYKNEILIGCDNPDTAKKLTDQGFYVVGIIPDAAQTEGEGNTTFEGLKYVFSDIDQVEMDSFVKAYQRYSGEPWDILDTERLHIRETTVDDVDEFYKLYRDPEMTRYMEGLFENPEDEKRYQKDYIEKVYGLMGFGVWTLVRKSDGAVIGRAGYSVRNGFDDIELGFLVGTEYQRQGYAYEACKAILDYGRDMLLFEEVQTLVKKENEVSIHICEKLGFIITDEVDVEENIYGDEYMTDKRVSLNEARFGKYVRMLKEL